MNLANKSTLAPSAPRHPLHGLLLALASVLVAGTVRLLLNPVMGDRVPYATFFLAIVVAIRYSGLWSSLLTMTLGLAWALYFWFPEGLQAEKTVFGALVYLFSSLAIIALGERMHQAEALAGARSRELQDAVQVLRASQGRLQLATEVSGAGVFEWDMGSDRFTGENPEAYRIFGRTPEQAKMSMADFIERHVHPEDSEALRAQLQQAMQPGERFHGQFRNRGDGDDWRWMEVVGRFMFDAERKPTQLIGVIADVTERRELEDSLRRMAADLSEADHRKDEFLATLAHELRNPLAPIRNGIELLKRAEGGSAQTRGVVGVMERQMTHMVRLVDDLIDVSRITRNKLELRKQPVELAQVILAAVEACRPSIDAKAQQLTVSLPPTPVHLDADLTRLVQVLANLLNNANKYTDRGGLITLAAERQGMDAMITVTDNGSGIPLNMQARVFDMFTQLERTVDRSQGGLGIGLSMVKRLVELHGGSVEIDSGGAGLGTRVGVRLPTVLSPLPSPSGASFGGRGSQLARRILVADDNRDAADSLAEILRLMGHEVATAEDGLDALAQFDSFRPEVVMLDIGMPRMNGYEACRRLRQREDCGDVVVIAVTGWGQDEDRLRSQEAGFNLHLTKPVDPAAVEALLASLPPARATKEA
ncbi:MAG: response regulator [Arenimonas sp.]